MDNGRENVPVGRLTNNRVEMGPATLEDQFSGAYERVSEGGGGLGWADGVCIACDGEKREVHALQGCEIVEPICAVAEMACLVPLRDLLHQGSREIRSAVECKSSKRRAIHLLGKRAQCRVSAGGEHPPLNRPVWNAPACWQEAGDPV